MTPEIARICRYPVKGLSVEDLDHVSLRAGERLPGDRRFAIARGSAEVDPAEPAWASKQNFITLMRVARLAQLQTRYDDETGDLTILRGGRKVAKGRITEPMGRTMIEQFLAAFLKDEVTRTPKLIDGQSATFTDDSEPFVSLINLASVQDLTRVAGGTIDPVRFRGNLLLDGLEPWTERSWIGRDITIGDVTLKVVEPITRCAATDVNPETAERDTNLLKVLKRGYGHLEMGVFAKVVRGGTIRRDDSLEMPETAVPETEAPETGGA